MIWNHVLWGCIKMPISPLQGLPPLPFPVIPSSYDESLSFMELLCKIWNACSELITAQNATAAAVTQMQEQIAGLPQLSDVVAQLQLDLAAETQARSDGYDTLYGQINQVRTLVINEYVDNQTFDATLSGGIKFNLIAKAAYDALTEYDSHTVYVVYDTDNSFKFWYMGQHATCCEPSTWGEINSSMYSHNSSGISGEPATLTTGLLNIPAGTLLVGVTSSQGDLAAGPDESWELKGSGILTSTESGTARYIKVYTKIAEEGGAQSFSVTVPAAASWDLHTVNLIAIPDAHRIAEITKVNEAVFTSDGYSLDTTPDEHRLYLVFSDPNYGGVSTPSPLPYGLNQPYTSAYQTINGIYQYHCTAAETTLTGVPDNASVTGLLDIWTLKFT